MHEQLTDVVPTHRGSWWKNEQHFGPEFSRVLRRENPSDLEKEQRHTVSTLNPTIALQTIQIGAVNREAEYFPLRRRVAANCRFHANIAARSLSPSMSLSAQVEKLKKMRRLREQNDNTAPRLRQSPLNRTILLNLDMNPGFIAEKQEGLIRNAWSTVQEGERALALFLRNTPPCTASLGSRQNQSPRSLHSHVDASAPRMSIRATRYGLVPTAEPAAALLCPDGAPKPNISGVLKPSAPTTLPGLQRDGFRSSAGRSADRSFAATHIMHGCMATSHQGRMPTVRVNHQRLSLDWATPLEGPRLLLPPTVLW
jgi:hypothetical protein